MIKKLILGVFLFHSSVFAGAYAEEKTQVLNFVRAILNKIETLNRLKNMGERQLQVLNQLQQQLTDFENFDYLKLEALVVDNVDTLKGMTNITRDIILSEKSYLNVDTDYSSYVLANKSKPDFYLEEYKQIQADEKTLHDKTMEQLKLNEDQISNTEEILKYVNEKNDVDSITALLKLQINLNTEALQKVKNLQALLGQQIKLVTEMNSSDGQRKLIDVNKQMDLLKPKATSPSKPHKNKKITDY